MSPRSERKGAAADEATHLHEHKSRSSDLVRIENRVGLRGQTHMDQNRFSEIFQASYWGPVDSHSSSCKQAGSASDRRAQSRGSERSWDRSSRI
jgi:hypothetical protein